MLSYEDPILLNTLKSRMTDRKRYAEEELGAPVSSHYIPRRWYDTNRHTPSPGDWKAVTDYKIRDGLATPRSQRINAPLTPSLANAYALEEEIAHAEEARKPKSYAKLRASQKRGFDHENFNEEVRAKNLAIERLGGHLTPDVAKFDEFTRRSYWDSLSPEEQDKFKKRVDAKAKGGK